MIGKRMRTAALCAVVTATILVGASGAHAAAPVKLVLTSQFGREVNLTEAGKGAALEDICTVASGNTCQLGNASSIPGGFEFAESVAGTPTGNVYVADDGNHRIQELTPTGQFVLMFGKDVNETTGGDICTAEEIAKSAVKCKAGVEGGAPGQLGHPYSIAVDSTSGDLYVAEYIELSNTFGQRVQKFTPEGGFILEIGEEVNEKTKGNLCTREEEVKESMKCTAPAQRSSGTPFKAEPGSFNFESGFGDLLAVGATGTLYVGDEGRVQEFKNSGEFNGEIPLAPGSRVDGLTVDQAGDLYLTYDRPGISGSTLRVFNSKGEETKSFEVQPPETGAEVRIRGLALDSEGHLAVAAEQQIGSNGSWFGLLYEAGSGRSLMAFNISHAGVGVGFNGHGELFDATGSGQMILAYKPVFVAELLTGVFGCVPGRESDTDVSLDCTLDGEVNTEGVPGSEAWFEWGETTVLGERTPKQSVAASGPVHAMVVMRPNASYSYRLAGEDANARFPELLTGERASLATPLVAPRVIGAPSASFVRSSAADLSGVLNPENAGSEYYFEYAAGTEALVGCAGVAGGAVCPGVMVTGAGHSGVYGRVGVTLEASALQPSTLYSYRLVVVSENTAKTERLVSTGVEGSFTTVAAPVLSARTGGSGRVGSTSASVSGMVDAGGVPASYAFELGVYEGANTQYAVVFSGPAGSGSGPVGETLGLSGLQPGTTYAYRITVSSGYIANASHTLMGETALFTTAGVPAVLSLPRVLALLSVPSITFPVEARVGTRTTSGCRRGYTRAKHGRCVKAKLRKGRKASKSTGRGQSRRRH